MRAEQAAGLGGDLDLAGAQIAGDRAGPQCSTRGSRSTSSTSPARAQQTRWIQNALIGSPVTWMTPAVMNGPIR